MELAIVMQNIFHGNFSREFFKGSFFKNVILAPIDAASFVYSESAVSFTAIHIFLLNVFSWLNFSKFFKILQKKYCETRIFALNLKFLSVSEQFKKFGIRYFFKSNFTTLDPTDLKVAFSTYFSTFPKQRIPIAKTFVPYDRTWSSIHKFHLISLI